MDLKKVDLNEKKVTELREIAKKLGISDVTKLRKSELISEINKKKDEKIILIFGKFCMVYWKF